MSIFGTIPRPRGRGLIEARLCRWLLSRCRQFHDRAVVASLKQFRTSTVLPLREQFHDRAVVASLKPEVSLSLHLWCA